MMKRMSSLLGVVLTCVAANLSTQTAAAADESGAPDYRPFTLGLEASTTGFGGAASWRFAEHFGARAGFNYFGYSKNGNEIEGISYNTDLRLMSEPLAVDIYPWAHKTFRVTVGILLNQNQIEGTTPPTVPGQTFVPIGDSGTSYDLAGIGGLNMKIEQMAVSPYLSVGASWFFDKAKHWSLSGELGVAYTGNPDVSLTPGTPGTVNPADLASETQQLEDWANKYKFYPILKLSVNYSF
jgi:hypothetical protein